MASPACELMSNNLDFGELNNYVDGQEVKGFHVRSSGLGDDNRIQNVQYDKQQLGVSNSMEQDHPFPYSDTLPLVKLARM